MFIWILACDVLYLENLKNKFGKWVNLEVEKKERKEKKSFPMWKRSSGTWKMFYWSIEEEDIPNKKEREGKKESMVPSITTTISLFLFIFSH